MPLWKWTDRHFAMDFPPRKWPDLLERLRGAPPRAAAMVAGVPEEVLAKSDGKGWSAKQNLGHLIDLGYLPVKRIEQILAGEKTLIGADMTNKATHEADHNNTPIATLLARFEAERSQLVTRFESLEAGDWEKSAIHPRLQMPMRIVDIAYFDSEHDDYHLARMREVIRAVS